MRARGVNPLMLGASTTPEVTKTGRRRRKTGSDNPPLRQRRCVSTSYFSYHACAGDRWERRKARCTGREFFRRLLGCDDDVDTATTARSAPVSGVGSLSISLNRLQSVWIVTLGLIVLLSAGGSPWVVPVAAEEGFGHPEWVPLGGTASPTELFRSSEVLQMYHIEATATLYEQGGLNHDMSFSLTAIAFYSLERPEVKVSMAYHPTNMTISLLPVISEDGNELHWENQEASVSYVTDLDQAYWTGTSYMGETTGAFFSYAVEFSLAYHRDHPRYQPFSVYEDYPGHAFVTASSCDEYVWELLSAAQERGVRLAPAVMPQKYKIVIYSQTMPETIVLQDHKSDERVSSSEEENDVKGMGAGGGGGGGVNGSSNSTAVGSSSMSSSLPDGSKHNGSTDNGSLSNESAGTQQEGNSTIDGDEAGGTEAGQDGGSIRRVLSLRRSSTDSEADETSAPRARRHHNMSSSSSRSSHHDHVASKYEHDFVGDVGEGLDAADTDTADTDAGVIGGSQDGGIGAASEEEGGGKRNGDSLDVGATVAGGVEEGAGDRQGKVNGDDVIIATVPSSAVRLATMPPTGAGASAAADGSDDSNGDEEDDWEQVVAYYQSLQLCLQERKFSFVTSLRDFAQYFDCLDDVAFISIGPHEYYKVNLTSTKLDHFTLPEDLPEVHKMDATFTWVDISLAIWIVMILACGVHGMLWQADVMQHWMKLGEYGQDDEGVLVAPPEPPSLTRKLTSEHLRLGHVFLAKPSYRFSPTNPASAAAAAVGSASAAAASSLPRPKHTDERRRTDSPSMHNRTLDVDDSEELEPSEGKSNAAGRSRNLGDVRRDISAGNEVGFGNVEAGWRRSSRSGSGATAKRGESGRGGRGVRRGRARSAGREDDGVELQEQAAWRRTTPAVRKTFAGSRGGAHDAGHIRSLSAASAVPESSHYRHHYKYYTSSSRLGNNYNNDNYHNNNNDDDYKKRSYNSKDGDQSARSSPAGSSYSRLSSPSPSSSPSKKQRKGKTTKNTTYYNRFHRTATISSTEAAGLNPRFSGLESRGYGPDGSRGSDGDGGTWLNFAGSPPPPRPWQQHLIVRSSSARQRSGSGSSGAAAAAAVSDVATAAATAAPTAVEVEVEQRSPLIARSNSSGSVSSQKRGRWSGGNDHDYDLEGSLDYHDDHDDARRVNVSMEEGLREDADKQKRRLLEEKDSDRREGGYDNFQEHEQEELELELALALDGESKRLYSHRNGAEAEAEGRAQVDEERLPPTEFR